MDVSKNSGTPKSSILIGFSIINHPFWGTPIFGNTYIYIYIFILYRYVYISLCNGLIGAVIYRPFLESFFFSRLRYGDCWGLWCKGPQRGSWSWGCFLPSEKKPSGKCGPTPNAVCVFCGWVSSPPNFFVTSHFFQFFVVGWIHSSRHLLGGSRLAGLIRWLSSTAFPSWCCGYAPSWRVSPTISMQVRRPKIAVHGAWCVLNNKAIRNPGPDQSKRNL